MLKAQGIKGSALAGLHAHFLAAIAGQFEPSDIGCPLLPAEWMDVGYGSAMREILTRRLALTHLRTFDKRAAVFQDAMSSAVIVGFSAQSGGKVSVNNKTVSLSLFAGAQKWSEVVDGKLDDGIKNGFVRLGDFARVHRGVATGKNKFWVREPGEVSEGLCVPVVAHAKDLVGESPRCRDVSRLSRLVTLPADLSQLPYELQDEAKSIVRDGLRGQVDKGYVARQRRSWWSIRPPESPAIMMTYMARRAPTFVVNSSKLVILNVVHGIYPTVDLSDGALERLVDYLNNHVSKENGRVYAGGLAKFEPREVERLIVPSPDVLEGRL